MSVQDEVYISYQDQHFLLPINELEVAITLFEEPIDVIDSFLDCIIEEQAVQFLATLIKSKVNVLPVLKQTGVYQLDEYKIEMVDYILSQVSSLVSFPIKNS